MSSGWERIESDTWELVIELAPRPLPAGLASQDLRYWQGQARRGRRRPSLLDLAKRWGWLSAKGRPSIKRVRLLMAGGSWEDPLSSPRLAKGHAEGTSGAREGHDEGTSGAREGHAEGTPKTGERQQPNDQGHAEGTQGAREGHGEGKQGAGAGHGEGPTRVLKHPSPFTLHPSPSSSKKGAWRDRLPEWWLDVPDELRVVAGGARLNLLSAVANVLASQSGIAERWASSSGPFDKRSVADDVGELLARWHAGDPYGTEIWVEAVHQVLDGMSDEQRGRLEVSLRTQGDPGDLAGTGLRVFGPSASPAAAAGAP